MRVAFDVHGVLDSLDYFRKLLRGHYLAGDEVFIISGQKFDENVAAGLAKHNLTYHKYISIVEWLEWLDVPIEWNNGLPTVPEHVWDTAKSAICLKYDVDIMFDDSPVYGKYFGEDHPTLYVQILNPTRKKYIVRQEDLRHG
jgi:hypothetical protein